MRVCGSLTLARVAPPVLMAAYGLGACGGADAPGERAWFVEGAAKSGLVFEHAIGPRRHFSPENIGSGVCVLDFDGDGALDLYLVQSGDLAAGADAPSGSRLFKNQGDGSFRDVTEAAGVAGTGYGMGCACGDYDGDGDTDLFVSNLELDSLYRNEGDGRFSDVSREAGLDARNWSAGATFLDFDDDGDLDLFVTGYHRWSEATNIPARLPGGRETYANPADYRAPLPDSLYENQGDGRFVDISEAAGLRAAFGNGLGVVAGDFDGDGDLDLYVANDGTPNQLWINAGPDATPRFEDRALALGCAVNSSGSPEAGMGLEAFDPDGDGDLDFLLSHLRGETNTLYENGGQWFSDTTARSGLGAASLEFTGFGLCVADFDQDGVQDVYVANGRVVWVDPVASEADPHAEPNLVFRGLGGRFEVATPQGGTEPALVHTSRGAALGDFDADGDLDLCVSNNAGPAYLLENVAAAGHGVLFSVLDARGREALHARLSIEAGGVRQTRQVQRAGSYLSSHDVRVHFGLGEATRVERVLVTWRDGAREAFGPFDADRVHTLQQGHGRGDERGATRER